MGQSLTNLLKDSRAADVRDAPKPFDSSAQADVILRSSDSVDFFVVKSLLCLVSPIFKDMFSLNRGEALEKNEMKNGVPVVPLEEDSETVNNLLLLIYPYARQLAPDVDVLIKTAKAAQKYGMDEIKRKLRRLFLASQVVIEEPLRAFCVGMHLGWRDVVNVAAFNTLGKPLQDLGACDELEFVRVADYHRLLQWRLKCEDAVDELFLEYDSYDDRVKSRSPWLFSDWVRDEGRKLWKETGCPRGTERLMESMLEDMENRKDGDSLTVDDVDACKELMELIDLVIFEVPLDMVPVDIVVEKAI
ncbi:hypothetical protein AX17_004181 [Amanita inopinata Kibby_2008]|nr:hypothetical protein AX17_004181 [Amanita inopinata Kibby_2008]